MVNFWQRCHCSSIEGQDIPLANDAWTYAVKNNSKWVIGLNKCKAYKSFHRKRRRPPWVRQRFLRNDTAGSVKRKIDDLDLIKCKTFVLQKTPFRGFLGISVVRSLPANLRCMGLISGPGGSHVQWLGLFAATMEPVL